MTIHSIERISLPDRDTFFRDYVFKRKPVVITNLFATDPISQVRTRQDASAMFGGMKLVVRQEYMSSRNTPARHVTSVMTFDEYWTHVQNDPTTKLLCTEYDLPAPLMMQFKLPEICRAADLGQREILDFPRRYGDHDLFSNLFIAGQDNRAHIHYDGDHRQVLLYQVFGRKEVILLPPAGGARYKPLDQYNLDLHLHRLSREERLKIIDESDGYHTVIGPGEALYMPMLIWHYLEYVDDAMSFNVRFGRNRYGRFLCIDNFHRDYYVQTFASNLADPALCETRYAEAIAAITAEYQKRSPDLPTKVRDMRQLFKGLCEQFFPEARADQYATRAREEDQLQEILRDLDGRTPYLDPAAVMRMRPAGPMSPTQRSLIAERAAKCGYSADQFRHIVFNRTGKKDVEFLNKAEAVQMISYLASPGAEC
jgi:lysine-specific demethylase 8